MTKREEYEFQKRRMRHPTFLQDLVEKEKTKKKKHKFTKSIKRENNVWLPKDIINVEKLTKEITPEQSIIKKIWG